MNDDPAIKEASMLLLYAVRTYRNYGLMSKEEFLQLVGETWESIENTGIDFP